MKKKLDALNIHFLPGDDFPFRIPNFTALLIRPDQLFLRVEYLINVHTDKFFAKFGSPDLIGDVNLDHCSLCHH